IRRRRLLDERASLGQRDEAARFLGLIPGPRPGGHEAQHRGARGSLKGDPEPARLAHQVAEPVERVHGFRSPGTVDRAGPGSTQTSPLTDAPSAAAKLPVLSEPVRTPVGRISTRVAAERLPRTVPPITMARPLMLASTSAP